MPEAVHTHCKRHLACIMLFVHCRFEEDVALQQRMSAIVDIIQEHRYPHFVCFQVNMGLG